MTSAMPSDPIEAWTRQFARSPKWKRRFSGTVYFLVLGALSLVLAIAQCVLWSSSHRTWQLAEAVMYGVLAISWTATAVERRKRHRRADSELAKP